jgi:integrase
MKALWTGCGQEGAWLGPFIRLLLLTGMRRGEPIAAKIEDGGSRLNLDATKQGARHVVVLPRQARGLLEAARGVGLAGVTNPKTLGWTQRWDRLLKLSGLSGSGITIHDLRRTWATTAARIGVDPLIIELCLGHAPSGVLGRIGAVYNRHSYSATIRVRCATIRMIGHRSLQVG